MAGCCEDADYVDQVMASQSILQVDSTDICISSDARKRRLSSDDESESGVPAKKEKPDLELAELMKIGFADLKEDMTNTLDKKFESFENKLKNAILATVQEEINNVRKEFNDRIDGLSRKLEEKICSNMQSKIDSKLQQAKSDMKKDLNLNKIKEDVSKLQKSYAEAAAGNKPAAQKAEEPKLQVVVRNLKYDEREERDPNMTVNLVKSLVRDGLKLADVKITHAERKRLRNNKPGVVIVKFESLAQKETVLSTKKSLRKIRTYQDVYIEDERSHEQRLSESNIRTLLQAVGKSKDYIVVNGRFVKRSATSTLDQ